MLILGILGGTGAAVYSLADDANELIESLPAAAAEAARQRAQAQRSSSQTRRWSTVQKAAAELRAGGRGSQARSTAAPPRGVQRVVVEKPRFDIRDHLWTGTLGLASLIGQIVLVTFLTYFLLLSGDTFRRKLVKITGPGLAEKKLTVQALDEINAQIQRYLLVQLLASVRRGPGHRASPSRSSGLKHAAVWGVAAGILNLVPYIGSIVVTGAAALVAFLQFGELDMALAGGRRLAADQHRRGLPAGALAHQQGQPHEPGGGVHRRAGLGLAVGRVGPAAGHPHPDGGQGGLRPGRPPEAGRGVAAAPHEAGEKQERMLELLTDPQAWIALPR